MKTIGVAPSWLLAFLFLFAEFSLAQDLSDAGLQECAQAGIPECQFKYGQRLENSDEGPRDLVSAKRMYEAAYAAGYQPAGQALLGFLRKHHRTDTALVLSASRPTSDAFPTGESASTSAAPLSSDSSEPLVAPCAEQHSLQRNCMPLATGSPVEVRDKRLAVLLSIHNPTSHRAYVSRGLTRAYQGDQRLTILDASQSTAWSRNASRAKSALRLLGGFIPGGSNFSARAAAANLGRTAARRAVDAMPNPSGPANYLSAAYVEPAASMAAVIVIQLMDHATPVRIEMDIGGEVVRFGVAIPPENQPGGTSH